MSKPVTRSWLPRASTQFARTVYSELRRAGHTNGDIVRFINELMDLMSKDAVRAGKDDRPTLIDPEQGLPGSDSIHDILDFELRMRGPGRRRDEMLVAAAIDVVLSPLVASPARQRCHELLVALISHELRFGDSFGQLGPDRYLLVLPRAKPSVRDSMRQRIAAALDAHAHELPNVRLELRWTSVAADAQIGSAVDVLQQCFAAPPEPLECHATPGAPSAAPAKVAAPAPRRELVLALGGGAARAVSHAGVLEVLERANIRPVAVTGCSAGAIVGAMLACGMSPAAITARFGEFTSTAIYREMRRAFATFLRGARVSQTRTRMRYANTSNLAFYSDSALSALTHDQLAGFVEHFLRADRDIDSLDLPFSVVATDLVEGRPIRISHGSLHEAVAASCAVPGLFPPLAVGERLLIDGGNVTEVPIWTAHLFGLSVPVLAVYIGRPLNRMLDYRTSTEVSVRSNALIHAELVREQLRRADLLLTVPVDEIGWLDFRLAPRIVGLGRTAAEQFLPRIFERFDRVT
jgi:NTE family protein